MNKDAAQYIRLFFNEMVDECSGTDNGVDAALDDYIVDTALRPFMEYYISRLNTDTYTVKHESN